MAGYNYLSVDQYDNFVPLYGALSLWPYDRKVASNLDRFQFVKDVGSQRKRENVLIFLEANFLEKEVWDFISKLHSCMPRGDPQMSLGL